MNIQPVNKNDCSLLNESLVDLKKIAQYAKFSIENSVLNLDMGFDSRKNRKMIFNAKMKPNIPENIRNRKKDKTKRGRKRIFDEKKYKRRCFVVERTFAWEDKFRKLTIRYEKKQSNHLAFKLLGYTLINLRYYV